MSCQVSADDPNFPDVLMALTEPTFDDPASRQLVLDYSHIAPWLVSPDESEAVLPFRAAQILCDPLTRRVTLAGMLGIDTSTLTYYAQRKRRPNLRVRELAQLVCTDLATEAVAQLQWARSVLFADAWDPRPGWNADHTWQDWLTDISGTNGLLPLRRALRDQKTQDVLRGMMDPDSPYRERHGDACHLDRTIRAASIRGDFCPTFGVAS